MTGYTRRQASLENVLKCNVYCTSVEKFAAVNAIYARYFPKDPPARIFTCVPAWPGPFDIENRLRRDSKGSVTMFSIIFEVHPKPSASTLNADDLAVTSNMAIVPTSNGVVNALASSATHVILDVYGYFAP
jgi:hypothetical protein